MVYLHGALDHEGGKILNVHAAVYIFLQLQLVLRILRRVPRDGRYSTRMAESALGEGYFQVQMWRPVFRSVFSAGKLSTPGI